LDFCPQVSLEDGLGQFTEWFNHHWTKYC